MALTTLVVVLGNTNDAAGQLSPAARSRLDTALDYFGRLDEDERALTRMVTTGAFGSFNPSPVPHGVLMARYLVANGVPEDALLPFIPSNGTIQDGSGAARLLSEAGLAVGKLVIVTSRFHMERARTIFARVLPGMDIVTVTDDDLGTPEQQRHERRAMANLDRELPAREGGTPSPGGLGTGGEKDRG
jgi:uncharacterized SAM-binding protein YcdF (DUF218 family)